MPNAITLFQAYVPLLDEIYVRSSLTSVLDGAPELARFGNNANELVIRVYTNLRNRRVSDQPAQRFGLNGAVELLLG